jgi:hypothetical protein
METNTDTQSKVLPTKVTTLPAVDTPPENGEWVEHDDLKPTDEEIAKGNELGKKINTDDDEDNGIE